MTQTPDEERVSSAVRLMLREHQSSYPSMLLFRDMLFSERYPDPQTESEKELRLALLRSYENLWIYCKKKSQEELDHFRDAAE